MTAPSSATSRPFDRQRWVRTSGCAGVLRTDARAERIEAVPASASAGDVAVRMVALAALAAVAAGLALGACGLPPDESGAGTSGAPSGTEHSGADPALDIQAIAPFSGPMPMPIVATIGQITSMVEAIGGPRVSVTQIVPGRDDPHLYVPAPRDLEALTTSAAVFYNGLFLEGQMGETLSRLQDFGVVAAPVASGIPPDDLLTGPGSASNSYPGAFDPHLWFDPTLWSRAAGNVAAVLSALDPADASGYAERLAAYEDRLRELAVWADGRISTVPEHARVLVTSHDAFGYLGRAFGLEVVGLQGLSTEAEPGTAEVRDLVRFVVDAGVPAVFVEASVSPEALEAVVEAARFEGHEVAIGGELFSDTPGIRGSAEGTYEGMLVWNIATIATALGGDAGGADDLPAALRRADEGDAYVELLEAAKAAAVLSGGSGQSGELGGSAGGGSR